MSKLELITEAIGRLSESDLDKVFEFLRTMAQESADASMPALAAESALTKDWLTPEEEAAWAKL